MGLGNALRTPAGHKPPQMPLALRSSFAPGQQCTVTMARTRRCRRAVSKLASIPAHKLPTPAQYVCDHQPCHPVHAIHEYMRQACLGLAIIATVASAALGVNVPDASAVTTEQLLFLEAWRAIDQAYYDKTFNGNNWFKVRETYLNKEDFSNRQKTYDVIRKLLATLDDPFTRFLDPDRLNALKSGTKGAVTGIGLEITFDARAGANSDLVVVAPQPGGPGDEAGIRAGDRILQVDGRQIRGLSLYEAIELLQGQAGTEVSLTVQPRGQDSTRVLSVTRRLVSFNPVSYQMCSAPEPRAAGQVDDMATGGVGPATSSLTERVGYLRVATFSSQTEAGVREALLALREQGATELVLDIRNNGGGLFPAGVAVARMLLSSGDIVLIADNQGVRDIVSSDLRQSVDTNHPLAVIVNKGTASASEVLAGALKDNNRALVVGEPTFGKGLIQTLIPLSDGSGVAVTVARYQTPAGVDINKVGITPDVPLAPEAIPNSGDGVCGAIGSGTLPPLFRK